MKEWFETALQPSVVKRGFKYSLVVGAILISINHGDALLHGRVDRGRLWRMGLTMMVPYLVSTFSSVGAIRQMRRRSEGTSTRV